MLGKTGFCTTGLHVSCPDTGEEDNLVCSCECHEEQRISVGIETSHTAYTKGNSLPEAPREWLIQLNNDLHLMGHKSWLTSAKRAEILSEVE